MNFVTIKVRGVIINDGKIFLCKLADAGFYCLPGGTFEKGETLKECLEREFMEEIGLKPIIGELFHVHEFFTKEGNTCIDFWYQIMNADDFKVIDLSKTTHGFELSEAGFYDIKSIEDYRPSNLKEIIKL